MTDLEFSKEVMSILARELGPGGYARYLMLYHSGKGDYTAERQANPDPRTLDEIWQELQARGLVQDGR